MITKDTFGPFDRYTITNEEMQISIVTLGASLSSIKYRAKERLLFYRTPEDLLGGYDSLCKTLGRYANRIGGAKFELNGKVWHLTPNEGNNILHGGPGAFAKQRWTMEKMGDDCLTFSIFSPSGDNGFPGDIFMYVTYSLKGSTVRVDFRGTTNRPTVFSPSIHPYFTAGDDGNVLQDARLQIFADGHLERNSELIPTGALLPCEGKYDFHELRTVDASLDECFSTPDEHALTLELGGIRMELWSDMPGVQVYTGEFLHPPFHAFQGIALEPEFFPDSPNHPEFPSTVLNPGEEFHHYAEYRFFPA